MGVADTKPVNCPKCGTAPNVRKIIPEGKDVSVWRVICPKCRLKGKSWAVTRVEAVRGWNGMYTGG